MSESEAPKRIALLLSRAIGYFRDALRGIKSYGVAHRWVFRMADPQATSIETVQHWDPAGIIYQGRTAAQVAQVLSLGRPAVNISGVLEAQPSARVGVDDASVGRLAAEHFLQRGFRHYAFAGYSNHHYSNLRQAAFIAVLRKAGFACEVFHEISELAEQRAESDWTSVDEQLRKWLLSLPRPTALMACNDFQGFELAQACRTAGLRVPEDVAILGVDNDELLCEMSQPALSSIALPTARIGYDAAALLSRLMQGGSAPRAPVLLPPTGVVVRASTDTVAVDDPDLAAALRFIREHAHESIGVGDVAARTSLSRRSLERRFTHTLGRTPLQEIRRMRMERARQLLANTDQPMPQVAQASGFANAERLSVVFREEMGMTPTE
mgnify:CR=1 FL=1